MKLREIAIMIGILAGLLSIYDILKRNKKRHD